MKKDLSKELEECIAGWQRTKADFLNYKKEESKRSEEKEWYIKEDMFLNLLPILDNLYLAEKQVKKKDEVIKGFMHIGEQIKRFFKEQGVGEIKTKGEKFNPELHEAVEEVKGKAGYIVKEVEKGYTFKDKLLRPAKVKVGK